MLGVLAKELASAPFADQTSKDIRERDNDRVSLAAFDFGEQGA